MSRQTLALTADLQAYIAGLGGREHPVLAQCRRDTESLGDKAQMQIAPEQGAFLSLLVQLTGARQIVEIGTFTGYSALAMALALPEDGKLTACDISEDYTAAARRYWADAGVTAKIDLTIGPAAETLAALIASGAAGTMDMAFIDADKAGYDTYYELCLSLLRPGGLIAIDNVLWSGAVADPAPGDADTEALKALNIKIHGDGRVDMVLLPVGDGLTLVRKR